MQKIKILNFLQITFTYNKLTLPHFLSKSLKTSQNKEMCDFYNKVSMMEDVMVDNLPMVFNCGHTFT